MLITITNVCKFHSRRVNDVGTQLKIRTTKSSARSDGVGFFPRSNDFLPIIGPIYGFKCFSLVVLGGDDVNGPLESNNGH